MRTRLVLPAAVLLACQFHGTPNVLKHVTCQLRGLQESSVRTGVFGTFRQTISFNLPDGGLVLGNFRCSNVRFVTIFGNVHTDGSLLQVLCYPHTPM